MDNTRKISFSPPDISDLEIAEDVECVVTNYCDILRGYVG